MDKEEDRAEKMLVGHNGEAKRWETIEYKESEKVLTSFQSSRQGCSLPWRGKS